jgi:uncharacterized protein (DUF58 family)
VREYAPGDEIRSIDWNVTARMNVPYIKKFTEERELTVMLLVDVSASGLFGSIELSKRELAAEVASILAFSAINNNDKVGLLLFTNEVELFIPPKKGRSHVLRIIRELIEFTPEGRATRMSEALDHFVRAMKKRTICFLVSDFRDEGFEDALRRASRRHDLVALRVEDPLDRRLPEIGWAYVQDPETGAAAWMNTSRPALRRRYAAAEHAREEALRALFARSGVDAATLLTDAPYVEPLLRLFDRRG